MSIWITIIAIGLITYAIRLSLILLSEHILLPEAVQRALRFVPDLVFHNGMPDVTLDNARLLAGILAIVVAWRTRNIIATVVSGMGALWFLLFVGHLP